ncbi:three-Cys-motif partner protein TcmP [uncultured Mucilaginibacter sp.]|uniref:three-Cys-motif partner protein TcmP n=1 Tax=uncultured Mucilaginibacter sp. TaxID=797541 RepID=UPI0025ED0B13|nr:three-Cys-motif partner protein TcmP [uncultured Mucilaginibacter sp.]
MNKLSFNPIQEVLDDGLEIPEVGEWGIEKYKCLGYYAEIFTKSMSKKWNNLVYIDLFASSGYCKIKKTNRIIKSGALISLSVTIPFKRYIFCEEDENLLNSLQQRVKRDYPNVDAHFISGDCNLKILDIINLIPKYSSNNTVLSFAFIDPFRLNINFRTVQMLCAYRMDILMLIATGMAATRNAKRYQNPTNETIAKFLDDNNWRSSYQGEADLNDQSFTQFLAATYKANLEKLGYTKASDFHAVRYRQNNMNVLLYHLAFFSKDKLGNTFWDIVRTQYSGEQTSMF